MKRSFSRRLQDYRGSPNSSASFGAGASLAGAGAVEDASWISPEKKFWVGIGAGAIGSLMLARGVQKSTSDLTIGGLLIGGLGLATAYQNKGA